MRVRFFVLKVAAADFYLKWKISNFSQLARADLIVNSNSSLFKNQLQLEIGVGVAQIDADKI